MHRKLRKLNQKMHKLHFSMRWVIGISLMVGGVLGFMPILGFWMIPLGLLVLAPDFRWARRGYLSIMTWLRRYRDRHKPKKSLKEQE